MSGAKYSAEEQRIVEEREAACVKCWLGRYYCYCYVMEIDGTYFYPRIGFSTEDEYTEFANTWQAKAYIGTIYHNNCPTERFESVITCSHCGRRIKKPTGLVPGKDVFCPSCQGFFVYH